MAKTKDEQMVKPASGLPELLNNKPDFLKARDEQNEAPRGLEQMEQKDWVLPRLTLCQNNTPQKDRSNPSKYIEGLVEGLFFNSLTKEIYGEKVSVVPLFFFKSRWMFRDFDQGGGVLCQAPDGKSCQLNNGGPCLHADWGKDGTPPDCTEFFNYPCILVPSKELIVVSLKVSGLKAGKEWNSLMRLRHADVFSGIYDVQSVGATNKNQLRFYTYKITNSDVNKGWVDNEMFQFAEEMYKNVFEGVKAGKIGVDTSTIADETSSDDHFAASDSEV